MSAVKEKKVIDPETVFRGLMKEHAIDKSQWRTQPLDAELWEAWSCWFDALFRSPTTKAQSDIVLRQLHNEDFTNNDMKTAGEWWARTGHRWPYVSDLYKCPDLTRHEG